MGNSAVKCLVTGVAGFIGSHLAERLLGEGHQVVGIDSLTEAYEVSLKEENLEQLRSFSSFQFVRADLLQCDLEEVLGEVEVVYHLAAQAGVRSSWGGEFELYIKRNILATQRLLESCRDKQVKKFVFASSSSVYGEQQVYPTPEGALPRPLSPYGVSKLAAEHLCSLYWKNFGIPCVSLRYFTVYGPRQRPDMAFHRFMKALWSGAPIVVFGDGTQSRDFTYVSDIVDATLKAALLGVPGKVYNVGGGSNATLREVLILLEELTGVTPKIVWNKMERGDVMHTMADLALSHKDLHYRPTVKLREGLKNQWEWMCQWLERKNQSPCKDPEARRASF